MWLKREIMGRECMMLQTKPKDVVKRYAANKLYSIPTGVGRDLAKPLVAEKSSQCGHKRVRQKDGQNNPLSHKSPPPLHSSVLFGNDFWLPDPSLKPSPPVIFPYRLCSQTRRRITDRKATMADGGGYDYLGVFMYGMMDGAGLIRGCKKRKRETEATSSAPSSLSYFESTEMDYTTFVSSRAANKLRRRIQATREPPLPELDAVLPKCIMQKLVRPTPPASPLCVSPPTPTPTPLPLRPRRHNNGHHNETRCTHTHLPLTYTYPERVMRRYAELPIDPMVIECK